MDEKEIDGVPSVPRKRTNVLHRLLQSLGLVIVFDQISRSLVLTSLCSQFCLCFVIVLICTTIHISLHSSFFRALVHSKSEWFY